MKLALGVQRLDLYVEYTAKAVVRPVCEAIAGHHDQHPEHIWRHLDTPPTSTPACPGWHVWSTGQRSSNCRRGKHSPFTLQFEAFAVQILKVSRSKEHTRNLLRLEWHQT